MAMLAELSITRLALGIELVDAALEQRTQFPLAVVFDDIVLGNVRPRLLRHPSNRFTLTYDDYFAPQPRTVDIRVFDVEPRERRTRPDRRPRTVDIGVFGVKSGLGRQVINPRRFVPRRLRIALRSLAQAEAQPPLARTCRPRLFPGTAYPIGTLHTGLRGRAVRQASGGRPLRPARWVRVVATRPANQDDLSQATVVGRAFGDDRGEFLLLIGSGAFTSPPQQTLPVRITVFASPETDPDPADLPQRDPFWDLPLEALNTLTDTDAVLRGTALPGGYAEVADRKVALPIARLLRGEPDYTF